METDEKCSNLFWQNIASKQTQLWTICDKFHATLGMKDLGWDPGCAFVIRSVRVLPRTKYFPTIIADAEL